MKWAYLINAIISIACFIFYLESYQQKVNPRHILLFFFTNVANYCFAISTFAENWESLYATFQLYYLGSIFTNISIILVIIELCGYKTNIFFRLFLFIYGAIIVFLIASIKHHKLYYVSTEFVQIYGMSYMDRQYGPLHNMLLILIFSTFIISITYICLGLKNKKDVPVRTVLTLLFMFFIGFIIYIFPKLIHLDLDFLPFMYTLMDIIALIIFRRAVLYDISLSILSVYEHRSEYGYIAFDINKRYLGSTEYAKHIFPFLYGFRLDKKFTNDDAPLSPFMTEILPWADEWLNGYQQTKLLTTGKIINELSMRTIQRNKEIVGYLIVIKDVTQQQKYIELMNNYNLKLQDEVFKKTRNLYEIQESIITGMAMVVESRDKSTGGHIKRTSECVKIFVEKLKLSEQYKTLSDKFYQDIIKAAPMHDLGKIAVPDDILTFKGKYSEEQYNKMKIHPNAGKEIVGQVLAKVDDTEFKMIAENVAHYHHEKWDGSGYPDGLKERDIPLEARIMAFADVFDALVSERCYKEAFSFDRAFEIISKNLGTHFDPELGPIFLSCRKELEYLYNHMKD